MFELLQAFSTHQVLVHVNYLSMRLVIDKLKSNRYWVGVRLLDEHRAYEVGEGERDEEAVGGRPQLRRAQEHEQHEEVAAHSHCAHDRQRRAHRVVARGARDRRRRRLCVCSAWRTSICTRIRDWQRCGGHC